MRNTVGFYEHTTAYTVVRNDPFTTVMEVNDRGDLHQCGSLTIGQVMTPQQFYPWAMTNLLKQNGESTHDADAITAALNLNAERLWLQTGETYYRIMPDMVPSLLHTELAVPSSLLRLPFASILIRLPIGHGQKELVDPSGGELRTIMICEIAPDTVAFLMDTGMQVGRGARLFWHTQPLTDERTIDELLSTGRDVTPTFGPRHTLTRNCVRVAASVIFMALLADTMVAVDVLNRDVDRYYDSKTSDENREAMRRRARRTPSHNGYVVGLDHRRRDIRLPRDRGSRTSRTNGKGRSLRYQHRRTGHWRFYVGSGGSVAHTWVRSAVVRPDLPPHADERGYAVGL